MAIAAVVLPFLPLLASILTLGSQMPGSASAEQPGCDLAATH